MKPETAQSIKQVFESSEIVCAEWYQDDFLFRLYPKSAFDGNCGELNIHKGKSYKRFSCYAVFVTADTMELCLTAGNNVRLIIGLDVEVSL